MLLWEMGKGFENTCTVSGKLNVSRVIPRLYEWVYKVLRLPQWLVELSVPILKYSKSVGSQSVIINAGSQLGRSQFEYYG